MHIVYLVICWNRHGENSIPPAESDLDVDSGTVESLEELTQIRVGKEGLWQGPL